MAVHYRGGTKMSHEKSNATGKKKGTTSSLTVLLSSTICFFLLLTGCSDGSDSPKAPSPYASDELWLCKPGTASNRCLEPDQTTTFAYSNTSFAVFDHTPAVDPEFDCFYVYPTVDLREEPGNTEDLTDDEPVLVALYNQAARFTELCNMYVPLYHQMTVGTLDLEGGYRGTEYYDIAFNDVDDAFNQYLRESGGRSFVLMGHSQGANLLMELLLQRIDSNEKLRLRLISALVIGSLGRFERAEGALEPEGFDNIPLCTHATQAGCIIAYDSIAAGGLEERVADTRACVNPTQLGGNPGVLENTIWEVANPIPEPDSIETRWVGYPGLYTANCEADGFLAIDKLAKEPDAPWSPQLLQSLQGTDTLHNVDVNWAMGDLLRIVSTQAENMP
jgi:hypothetical protein